MWLNRPFKFTVSFAYHEISPTNDDAMIINILFLYVFTVNGETKLENRQVDQVLHQRKLIKNPTTADLVKGAYTNKLDR